MNAPTAATKPTTKAAFLRRLKKAQERNDPITLFAKWTGPEGEQRSVAVLKSAEVGFMRINGPKVGTISYLQINKHTEVLNDGGDVWTIQFTDCVDNTLNYVIEGET